MRRQARINEKPPSGAENEMAELPDDYDNWNPKGVELYIHSEYYENTEEGPSGIDDGWDDALEDDDHWAIVSDMSIHGIDAFVSGDKDQEQYETQKKIFDRVSKRMGAKAAADTIRPL